MGQTRRRGTALEQAILDAAWAELAEVGYRNMTMGSVAERAGAAKSVLYRRWPDKIDLICAVIEQRVPPLRRLVPTGDLRRDVLDVLTRVVDRYQGLRTVTDPELVTRLTPKIAADAAIQLDQVVRAAGLNPPMIGSRLVRLPITLVISDLIHNAEDVDTQAIIDEIFLPLVELTVRRPERE